MIIFVSIPIMCDRTFRMGEVTRFVILIGLCSPVTSCNSSMAQPNFVHTPVVGVQNFYTSPFSGQSSLIGTAVKCHLPLGFHCVRSQCVGVLSPKTVLMPLMWCDSSAWLSAVENIHLKHVISVLVLVTTNSPVSVSAVEADVTLQIWRCATCPWPKSACAPPFEIPSRDSCNMTS